MAEKGILAVIAVFIELGLLIFKEYFSGQARAREEQKQYEMNRQKAAALVAECAERQRVSIQKESQQAGDMEDEMDRTRPK